MAYTYLDITNEVLARFNEVALTSANFANSRGFQTQCKNAVNDAINYIFQREFGWSFSHALQTETLVAGTTRYSLGATIYNVDYETFRISKNDTLGTAGVTLRVMEYKEYVDKYIDQETTSDVGGVPIYVFRTPDNNYGLFPYPDKAYELKYDADGATAYGYQYRGEAQQYGINFARFEEGIKHMQSLFINRDFSYVRSTYLPHSQRYGVSIFPSGA